MSPGKLMRIKFEFIGGTLEAVLDKLPTARILEEDEEKVLIEAEVYGNGITMWLLSQGSKIRVISPGSLVAEMLDEISRMQERYMSI